MNIIYYCDDDCSEWNFDFINDFSECVMLNDMKMICTCVYFKLIELQTAADSLYACACVNVRVST